MPDTQTNYERTKELTVRLEAGMKNLFRSDKYKNFLITMSRFHHYQKALFNKVLFRYRSNNYNYLRDDRQACVKAGDRICSNLISNAFIMYFFLVSDICGVELTIP